MYCAVYVTYTVRHKVYRDRIAYNLHAADARELARQHEDRGYDKIEIETYIDWPFRVGSVEIVSTVSL